MPAQHIIALPAVDEIRAVLATQRIVGRTANDDVVTVTTLNNRRQTLPEFLLSDFGEKFIVERQDPGNMERFRLVS